MLWFFVGLWSFSVTRWIASVMNTSSLRWISSFRTWWDLRQSSGFYYYPSRFITLDPSTSFFPQALIKTAESKFGFRLQLLYYTKSVATHCDWNQAPGCQRETPQIEGKTPQIEEKYSFRFNCLTLSRQAIITNRNREMRTPYN